MMTGGKASRRMSALRLELNACGFVAACCLFGLGAFAAEGGADEPNPTINRLRNKARLSARSTILPSIRTSPVFGRRSAITPTSKEYWVGRFR